ncbi:hypothetical protein P4U43_17030 [Arthrobacter sp. EH-1B-1]|uniref:Uncharacterized protein n=1 Tax=Arthrobacter vasquezii TaxID=2977629 RepID=A0ABT6D054_9MICC|nr:hypothetical protein [Arthrobacter vasquezii]MDF9279493.1 hypothetical protein [Arthrobacter vasquezii]
MLLAASLPALVPAPDEGQLRPGLDPTQVTPGLLGFLMTLFMVIAVIFLMRSMVGRIRRVRYREQAAEQHRNHTAAAGTPAIPDTVLPADAPHTEARPGR